MRKQLGFSLVEILVATVIFSLVMVGLFSVFVSGNKQIIHIRERMSSAQLGKFFLDPLQVYVRQDTWDQAGNELRVGSRAGITQSVNNRSFSEIHAVNPVAFTDLRRVITTISWTEPSS
ncbi:MAG: prepilin-type N-terminal cleavage/methylation domain-containing protein [Candidatus Omnitrophota bacterium]|nr:prepilin-type N-terminal cleavage/methylation domain-containing protein [Candidatus Omnitrophota bacterium]